MRSGLEIRPCSSGSSAAQSIESQGVGAAETCRLLTPRPQRRCLLVLAAGRTPGIGATQSDPLGQVTTTRPVEQLSPGSRPHWAWHHSYTIPIDGGLQITPRGEMGR
jgi:hypothetical protein